ncbi:MAG: twin-arginine translocation (Tat) [Bradyrhizobiaceae bacterium]|nr:MAG: twin-arginine translocation (Tat) [Bradyrhizobiaceae bacterium]
MERRHFLRIAFGFAAGAVVMASAAKVAEAAPIAPQSLPPLDTAPQAALATQDDLDKAHVEQVRWRWHWGHRRHWRWHRRHYRRHHRRYRRRWHW